MGLAVLRWCRESVSCAVISDGLRRSGRDSPVGDNVPLESQSKLGRAIAHQDRHAPGVREVVVSSREVLFAIAIEVPYDCRVRIGSHAEDGRKTKTAVAIAQ